MYARTSAFLVAFVLLTAVAAAVQSETGRVTGAVNDQAGLVVPGATITLTSTNTGALRTTMSDGNGRYLFANVPAGPYALVVELSGFATQRRDNIVVTVGGTVDVNTRLQVAATAETVTVVAESAVINLSNPEVATTIRQEQIRELPTLTRNVYDLVAIAGNVQTAPETTIDVEPRGAGFNINGQRASSTNILLDGAANNDEFQADVGQEIPLDSVQEFSVITNNFSAQYGRATGGIVNAITKSGANNFAGSVYEYFRNDALATNTPDNRANNIEKGKFTRHQPGYSIGGPVVRDKLFFFSGFEYIRVRSIDTELSWIPTPELLAATAAATRNFFNTYGQGATINGPTLTRADVSAIVGTGAGAFNSLPANLPVFGRVAKSLPIDAGGGDPQDNYQFVGRMDWNVAGNANAYVRYAYQNRETQPGTVVSSPYSGFDTGETKNNHNILGSFTRVFATNFTGQSKVVFNRLVTEQPVNGPNVPTLFMNTGSAVRLQGQRIAFPGYGPWSPGTAIPFGGPQQFIQLYQDQTMLVGAHDVRFGGSYVHLNDDRTFGAYSNSTEFLNTTSNALVSLNNLVSGQLARFQTAINPHGMPGGTYVTPVDLPSFTSFNRYDEFALYVQDNWNFTNRLTINLGLRYEYFGPQKKSEPKFDSNFYYGADDASVNSSTGQEMVAAVRAGEVLESRNSPTGTLWKSDWDNLAPRVGFAYDLTGDGRTSLRGGYGVSYERNFGNVTFNVLFNPPEYLVATIDAPTDVPTQPIFTDLAGPFGGVAGVTKTIPPGSLRHVDQNIETAYAHQYGVSLQRQLAENLAASVEYNGTSGRKLYDLADVNKRGAELIFEGTGDPAARPNPSFGAFNTRGNRGQSQYHGVTLGFDARALGSSGVALTTKYTLSSAKDNLSNTFSEGINGQVNLGYLDPFNCSSDNNDCGPMLDYGYAEFDVRHRLSMSTIWNIPFLRDDTGLKGSLLGGWAVNWIMTARSGYPFTLYDCTNGVSQCMRVLDPGNRLSRNVSSGTPTGNPNEFILLDYAPVLGTVGSYVNPRTGDSDWGPYPDSMTRRDDFRGPGAWFLDMALQKRFRIGGNKAATFRFEVYNLFDHANMYVLAETVDASSFAALTGRRGAPGDPGDSNDNRRMQLGFRFEF